MSLFSFQIFAFLNFLFLQVFLKKFPKKNLQLLTLRSTPKWLHHQESTRWNGFLTNSSGMNSNWASPQAATYNSCSTSTRQHASKVFTRRVLFACWALGVRSNIHQLMIAVIKYWLTSAVASAQKHFSKRKIFPCRRSLKSIKKHSHRSLRRKSNKKRN